MSINTNAVTAKPKLTLTAGSNPVERGADGVFTITLDRPAPAGGLTVNFDTAGSTATFGADYTLLAGENVSNLTANTFMIAAGATSGRLKVAALADAVVDPNEIVSVNVIQGAGYTVQVSASFADKVDYATGSYSLSVSVGDFNNDGKTDLAVVKGGSDTVSVLLRNATNTSFDDKVDYAVGGLAYSVSVGDFNNDGKTDLAIANLYSSTVSVLLRNAANTGFDAKVDYATGSHPVSVSVGDFNNDGKADLAVANSWDNTVSVLLRNATNTGFADKVDYAAGWVPSEVSVGDFNNDGQTDLVVANRRDNTVSVLLRNVANTGFDAKVDYATGYYPSSVSVGDFNNDGQTDLAVAGAGNTVSVLLRNATNTGFDAKADVSTGSSSESVRVGDFNNDGKTDLAVANYDSNTVSVLLNTSTSIAHASLTIAEAPNHAPTGRVTINDTTPETGQILTVRNTLKDADGLGAITYVWLANGDKVGTGNSYTVTGNDEYKVLSVTASYTDGWGKLESISSAGTSRVTIVDLTLKGTDGNDRLNGGGGNDILKGIAGNDILNGGNDADELIGGEGDDRLNGDSGKDGLVGGAGDDTLNGGTSSDKLRDIDGNNILSGDQGKDILIAGNGFNVLTGGDGKDSFQFASASHSTITDFVVADDTIKLENNFFTQLTTTGVLNADNFVISAAAVDANDYLVYNKATGALLYDADGNGPGAMVKIAMLGVNIGLTPADFVVT